MLFDTPTPTPAPVLEDPAAAAAATAAATPRSPNNLTSSARSFSKVMMDGEGPTGGSGLGGWGWRGE